MDILMYIQLILMLPFLWYIYLHTDEEKATNYGKSVGQIICYVYKHGTLIYTELFKSTSIRTRTYRYMVCFLKGLKGSIHPKVDIVSDKCNIKNQKDNEHCKEQIDDDDQINTEVCADQINNEDCEKEKIDNEYPFHQFLFLILRKK